MAHVRNLTFVSILISSSIVSCGPSTPSSSKLDTVEIGQTPIRNQMKVGFCWAFATTALMESRYKTRTGQDIELSPESIGFYRMAQGLHAAMQGKSVADVLALFVPGGIEGYLIKDTENSGDALALAETYGVVPESVWSFKFDTEEKHSSVIRALQGGLWKLVQRKLLRGKSPSDITLDEIIADVMTVDGAFPSQPPRAFDFANRHMTSVEFMHDFLQFQPSDYGIQSVASDADFEKLIKSTKVSLAHRVPVIIGFPVNIDLLNGDTFSGKSAGSDVDITKHGGHAVLITDFINNGGKEGEITQPEITAAVDAPSSELSYVILKNSWGTEAKTNESGVVIRGSKTGYYKMDREYLSLAAAAAKNDERVRTIFSVVLPKEYIVNP
jgi:hypothetical protein